MFIDDWKIVSDSVPRVSDNIDGYFLRFFKIYFVSSISDFLAVNPISDLPRWRAFSLVKDRFTFKNVD